MEILIHLYVLWGHCSNAIEIEIVPHREPILGNCQMIFLKGSNEIKIDKINLGCGQ